MINAILIIHVIIIIAMIGIILLQRSEGGGLGMGGGTGGFMTARGAANFLTRATAVLAGLFFFTSLFLALLTKLERNRMNVISSGDIVSTIESDQNGLKEEKITSIPDEKANAQK